MMMIELHQKNPPEKLVQTVARAVNDVKPRIQYRVGTSHILIFLELFSDKITDQIFKLVYGKRQRKEVLK